MCRLYILYPQCSQKCGGGVRTRTVDCVDRISGAGEEDAQCDINTKPPDIEDCNNQQCLEWTALEWGEVRILSPCLHTPLASCLFLSVKRFLIENKPTCICS